MSRRAWASLSTRRGSRSARGSRSPRAGPEDPLALLQESKEAFDRAEEVVRESGSGNSPGAFLRWRGSG